MGRLPERKLPRGNGARITIEVDPIKDVGGADFLYTDAVFEPDASVCCMQKNTQDRLVLMTCAVRAGRCVSHRMLFESRRGRSVCSLPH